MKFLCVECDEPMSLGDVRGPDDGSMSVVFGCPSCSRQVAMLTNAMETQVVRSLGVKIGGKPVDHEPMHTVRTALVTGSEPPSAAPSTPPSTAPSTPPSTEPPTPPASKCPFTGMVNEAFAAASDSDLEWSENALSRMERIPSFVRSMVARGVEDYARSNGHTVITEELLDDVRGRLGM